MKSRIILVASYVLAMAQTYWMYSKLPESFAVHFNPAGEPDAWATRTAGTLMMTLAFSFMTLLWLFLAMVMKRVPVKYFNLPNRDHWLAPERKADTLAAMGAFLSVMGTLTNVLLMAVFWLTFWANMQNRVRLDTGHTLAAVGIYLAALAITIGAMLFRFRKV